MTLMDGHSSSRYAVAKRVRFFFLDGVTILPVLFTMARPSMTMLYFTLGMSIALWIIDRKGLPLPMFFRACRTFFVGRTRYIRPSWRKR